MTLEIWSEEVCSRMSRSLKSVQGIHSNGSLDLKGKCDNFIFKEVCVNSKAQHLIQPWR